MPKRKNNNQQRARRMDNTKTDKGWKEKPNIFTGKAPLHQIAALKSKKKSNNILIIPMKPPVQKRLFDSVFCKAGKFAVPFIFSLTGVEDSALIGKALVNSFEESLKEYEITKDVDEAVITGIKSFFKNYIIDKAETSIINNFSPHKNDNIEFEAILNVTTSMSSVYAFMEIPDLYEI